MDSERYKILKRITIVLGVSAVVLFVLGIAVPLDAFPSAKSMCIACVLLGIVCLNVFIVLLTKLINNKGANTRGKAEKKKKEYDDKQLTAWLAEFEKFVKHAACLEKTSEKTFTKFGGMPTVPEDFEWATFEGNPIPFMLQIDFEEINRDGLVEDFPTSGLLYVFVDSDRVNLVDAVTDEDYMYREGKTFKIIFREKTELLREAKRPSGLQWVYKETYLGSRIVKTYPDTDDCDEALDIYCNRPCGGMDDEYDDMRYEVAGYHQIGGWATYIQSGGFVNPSNGKGEKWTLLMQIGSEEGDDEKFMWGDVGNLYFYILEDDLKARRFDNVKLEMQCT